MTFPQIFHLGTCSAALEAESKLSKYTQKCMQLNNLQVLMSTSRDTS